MGFTPVKGRRRPGGRITGVRIGRAGNSAVISIAPDVADEVGVCINDPAEIAIGDGAQEGLFRVRLAPEGYSVFTSGVARIVRCHVSLLGLEWLNKPVNCDYQIIDGALIVTLPKQETETAKAAQ